MNTLTKHWRKISIVGVVLVVLVAGLTYDPYEPPNEPTEPAAIEAKRFAHSLKIPDSVPTASFYPWWLGEKAYFDYLCDKEAGEFIFRKLENVDGVYQMRPLERAADRDLQDRYAMEDPYGYTVDATLAIPVLFIKSPKKGYTFFETSLSPRKANLDPQLMVERAPEVVRSGTESVNLGSGGRVFWRYFYESDSPQAKIAAEPTQGLRSKYGYTWRGIHRPHDRERGIAGGELIVFDMTTQEVLGVRRGFVYSKAVNIPSGIFWLYAKACPQKNPKEPARPYQFDYEFIRQVLSPSFKTIDELGAHHGK